MVITDHELDVTDNHGQNGIRNFKHFKYNKKQLQL